MATPVASEITECVFRHFLVRCTLPGVAIDEISPYYKVQIPGIHGMFTGIRINTVPAGSAVLDVRVGVKDNFADTIDELIDVVEVTGNFACLLELPFVNRDTVQSNVIYIRAEHIDGLDTSSDITVELTIQF
jgi:hypothetical protein